MKIIMVGVFAVTMTFANTPGSNTQPEKNSSNFLQFLLAECKDLYQSRSQQDVCDINKNVGIYRVSPYIVGLMKQAQPKQKEILNECTSHLSLQSRIVDYENTVKCFQTSFMQDIQQKISNEIDQTKLNQADSILLLDVGRMFLYGAGVQQDIEFSARSIIDAHNKGETTAGKYLLELMAFVDSNNIKLPEKLKDEITLTILQAVKDTIKTKALEGNIESVFFMANMADRKKAYTAANEWYVIGVKKNHSGSINNLAVNYAKGKGVEKNVDKAIELYSKAAKLGSKYAQQTLGNRYVNGRGVEKNIEKGIKYYEMSVSQGHAKAAYELAELYRKGTKIQQDNKKALMYFLKVVENSDSKYNKKAKALSWLGHYYEQGIGTTKDLKEARKWYLQAANLENKFAQSRLGLMYQKGYGVEKNYTISFNWYLKAAKKDHAFSQRRLAYLYGHGKGVQKDLQQSFHWYLKAGKQGDSYAQQQLGFAYRDGKGTAKNIHKAYEWFLKAAEQGKIKAMYSLATLLWTGQGISQDKDAASKWYHRSAEKDYALAQYWLGEMYARGDFVPQDFNKACFWTIKAANNGNQSATSNYQKFCN